MTTPSQISEPHTYIYENLYKEINPLGRDTIPASDAAAFLKRSNLNVNALGQIWELADFNKKGHLDKLGAFIALKLVAACQQGHAISPAALGLALGPPMFSSRSATPSIPNFGASPTSTAMGTPVAAATPVESWGIGPADQAKYESIFDGLTPIDGKVSGDKVRPVLLNSGLPSTALAKIWELSDIDKDGQLDRVEMCVALHLVYCTLQGQPVPNALPQSLIHSSKRSIVRTTPPPSFPPPLRHQTSSGRRSRTASVASLDNQFSHSVGTADAGRSQSVQPTSTSNLSTPTHAMIPPIPSLSPSLAWPVQSVAYEAQFVKADTNMDGLVSGADVRENLLATGVPQSTLARLWTLVDINKNGMLNLEQFALIMYLIEDCRRGRTVPLTLAPNLIPPSLRPEPAKPIATSSLMQQELTGSGNEELDALQREIHSLILDRREADQSIVQLEADITVKNSEIKNLQIELTTLENTVAQLERQKAEAGRRLDALDGQIVQLQRNSVQLREKLKEEEDRLTALRTENTRNKENAAREEEELSRVRHEVNTLEEEKRSLAVALSQLNAEVESGAIQLTKLESEVANSEDVRKRALNENEKMKGVIDRLNHLYETQDIEAIMREQADLLVNFPSKLSISEASRGTAAPPFTAVDPFTGGMPRQDDPFHGNDPFASSSSAQFSAFDEPFGASASDPFGGGASAVGAFDMAGGVSGTAAATKPPPPRPAPPKSRQTPTASLEQDPFASSDPFSSSAAKPDANQFANFADFGAFS